MNADPPIHLKPVSTVTITRKKVVPNILSINFIGKEDFCNFVNKTAKHLD